ncbi:MAG: sigma-70 family RNA polymerase sigma factor [Planctomycetota bacterium]
MSKIEGMLEHAQWLQPLARGLLEDDHLAEDVLQETWTAAWQRPPRDPDASPAWLRQVMRNFAKMKFRGDGRRRQRERLAARPEAQTDELPLETLELRREVVRALLTLDEPFQSTLILRFYEGMSSAEIARLEGVPATTVRVRLKRGLDRLRDTLIDRRDDLRPGLFLLAGLEPLHSRGAPALVAEATAKSGTGGGSGVRYTERSRWAAVAAGVLIVAVGWWSTSLSGGSRTGGGVEAADGRAASQDGVVRTGPTSIESRATPEGGGRAGGSAVPARAHESSEWVRLHVVDTDGDPVIRARVTTGMARGDRSQIAAGYGSAYEFLLAEPAPRLEGYTDREGTVRVRVDRLRDRSLAVNAMRYRVWRERPTIREFLDGEYHVTLSPMRETEIVAETNEGMGSIDGEIVVTSRFGKQFYRGRSGDPIAHRSGAEVELVSFRYSGLVAVQDLLASPRHRQLLSPGTVAYGTVLDPRGRPVVGAEVGMRSGVWRGPAHTVRTDDYGRFDTFGLPDEGKLTLEIYHPEFPLRSVEFSLPCTELGEISMEAPALSVGRVFGYDGEPLSGALVHALPSGRFSSRDIERVTTQDDGVFRFLTLRPGRHTIRVEHPHHAPAEWTGECGPAELAEPTMIHLVGGESLHGVVRSPTGAPLAGIPIRVGTIVGDELRGPVVRSGADGRFRIHNLPGGPVVHRARRNVVKWGALDEAERTGPSDRLLLEVFRPYQLSFVDDSEIPRFPHFGSRNTAAVRVGSEIELVVNAPEVRPSVRFELSDSEGTEIRAFSNVLIVSPDDWVMKDFAGVNGQPFHLPDPGVLDDAQLTIMSRGYCWRTVRVDLRVNAGRVCFVLTPKFERPPVLEIDGADEEQPFLVAPLLPGVEPLAALPVGTVYRAKVLPANQPARGTTTGRLVLEDLGPGRYALCTPLHPSALFGASGKRRLAMTMDEVQIWGHFTLTEAEGQIVPISLPATFKENR